MLLRFVILGAVLLAGSVSATDIRLRVVDPLDNPMVAVSLRLLALEDQPTQVTPFLFRTSETGEVDIVGLAPGRYQARMTAPRRRRRSIAAVREFEVRHNAPLQAHTFVLGLDPWIENETQFRIDGIMIGERRQKDVFYWLIFRRVGSSDSPDTGVMLADTGRFAVPEIAGGKYNIFCRVTDTMITQNHREYFMGDVTVTDDVPHLVLSWFERVR